MERNKLSYRPEQDSDQAFLRNLFASTRSQEMMALQPHPEVQQLFIEHQFSLQQRAYKHSFPYATCLILEWKENAVGRLCFEEKESLIHIIDIALLPEYRGKGIGSRVLKQLLKRALQQDKVVHLQVMPNNPAIHLYQRLGFEETARQGMHISMAWTSVRENLSYLPPLSVS